MRDTTDSAFWSRVIRVRARLGECWILLGSGLGSISTWGEERRDLLLGSNTCSSSSVLTLARQGSSLWDDDGRQRFGLNRSHGCSCSGNSSKCSRVVVVAVVRAKDPTMEMGPAVVRDKESASSGQAKGTHCHFCLQQDNCLRSRKRVS